MKRSAAILLLLATISCGRKEYSEELTEPAVVDQTIHIPSTHGSGIGVDMTGKGGVSIVSVDTSPDWVVVFRCQHGKFIIHSKEEWQRRVQGENVVIRYREVYRLKKDGRHLIDYDFLRAESVE